MRGGQIGGQRFRRRCFAGSLEVKTVIPPTSAATFPADAAAPTEAKQMTAQPIAPQHLLNLPRQARKISRDMNVSPIAPPARKINSQGIAVPNARLAGNRGKSRRLKTTPVLG